MRKDGVDVFGSATNFSSRSSPAAADAFRPGE
jgi:hypothetical protein